MATRLTDSAMYGHLWTTPELAALFGESERVRCWLDILAALAAAQASLGIVPAEAAEQLAACDPDRLDLEFVAAETRRTAHSTLGLIHGLQRILPEPAREYVYYGATVQDLTDTWWGILMRDVGALVRRDLARAHGALLTLAAEHRDTVMAGRTHGQPGAPITFGYKVATWADEIGRHLSRLDDAAPRWSVGQLAGAVGVLGFFAPHGPELRRRFCVHLGLGDPVVSWTSTRYRVAEFGTVLAMVAGTLARIGTEVYELQRPEIGELAEAPRATTVGSITMPHKRNPESSEHLDTLARVARAAAGVLLEGMAAGHERDGRAWKAEWFALPEIAHAAGTAASLAADLVSGLVVDAERMRANLGPHHGSERVLAELSARLGKHRAQELLQDALHGGDLSRLEVDWDGPPAVGAAGEMVDVVVGRGTP
jgi:adenylosuccinate lyase